MLTLVLILSTVIVSLVGRLSLGSEPRAVMAAATSIMVPIALGSTLRLWATWATSAELALRFGLGCTALLAIATALNLAGWFTVDRVVTVAGAMMAIALVAVTYRMRAYSVKVFLGACRPRLRKPPILGGLVAVAAVVATGVYWRSRSPLPFQSAWDGMIHLGIVNHMIRDGSFSLFIQNLSPTFVTNPYPPAFHLTLAASASLLGVPALDILWAGPFVLCALSAAGLYQLLLRTYRSVAAATGATAVSAFFLAGGKPTTWLTWILPASEVVAFAPFAFLVLATSQSRRSKVLRSIVVGGLLCSVHILMGLLVIGVAIASIAVSWAFARTSGSATWLKKVALCGLIAAGLLAAVLVFFASDLRNIRVASVDPTNFYSSLTSSSGLGARLKLIANRSPHLLPGILTAVAVVALAMHHRSRESTIMVSAVPVVTMVCYMVPIIGLERLVGFLPLVLPIALAAALTALERGLRRLLPRRRTMTMPLSAAACLLVPLLLLPLLAAPLVAFRRAQYRDTSKSERSVQSSFAGYELAELPVLARQYGTARPVVSDPVTQDIAQGLGGFTSVGGTNMSGRDRVLIASALLGGSSVAVHRALAAVEARFGTFFLIVTGRSERWAARLLKRYHSGDSYAELAHHTVLRPWDLSDLPDSTVTKDKQQLLNPIDESGCISNKSDRGEIVFYLIDCNVH